MDDIGLQESDACGELPRPCVGGDIDVARNPPHRDVGDDFVCRQLLPTRLAHNNADPIPNLCEPFGQCLQVTLDAAVDGMVVFVEKNDVQIRSLLARLSYTERTPCGVHSKRAEM